MPIARDCDDVLDRDANRGLRRRLREPGGKEGNVLAGNDIAEAVGPSSENFTALY